MRVCVLNGSPKGEDSITLQYVQFLEAMSPQDAFSYHHVGEKYKNFEGDEEQVLAIIEEMIDADLILVAFPVYSFSAPYQLMRFFETLRGHMLSPRTSNVHFTWITTSKKFMDHYAHKYMKHTAEDMGMRVLRGFSATDTDLYYEECRQELTEHWKLVSTMVKDNIGGAGQLKAPVRQPYMYFPDFKIYDTPKTTDFDTLILTDAGDEDVGLRNMIRVFQAFYPNRTREINVSLFNFANGCVGCMDCVRGDACVLDDGFLEFYKKEIANADAILYAGTISNNYLRTNWKCYEDRLFCLGLQEGEGKVSGYIFARAMGEEELLQDIYATKSEVLGNYVAGMVCDRSKDAAKIGDHLQHLAKEMDYALARKLLPPQSFMGKATQTLLRDMIYVNRGYMKREHKFAKEFGLYDDLPTNQIKQIGRMYRYGAANRMPHKRGGGYMQRRMLKDYKKLREQGGRVQQQGKAREETADDTWKA